MLLLNSYNLKNFKKTIDLELTPTCILLNVERKI